MRRRLPLAYRADRHHHVRRHADVQHLRLAYLVRARSNPRAHQRRIKGVRDEGAFGRKDHDLFADCRRRPSASGSGADREPRNVAGRQVDRDLHARRAGSVIDQYNHAFACKIANKALGIDRVGHSSDHARDVPRGEALLL